MAWYTEELEEAKKKACERKLPELTGTKKQIDWALVLRERALALIDEAIEKNLMDIEVYHEQARIDPIIEVQFFRVYKMSAAEVRDAKERLVGQTSASFWIDHRNAIPANLWMNMIKK